MASEFQHVHQKIDLVHENNKNTHKELMVEIKSNREALINHTQTEEAIFKEIRDDIYNINARIKYWKGYLAGFVAFGALLFTIYFSIS